MSTKTVELDLKSDRPAVWIVWAGIKSIPATHHIYCICSKEGYAIGRVDGYKAREREYYEGTEAEYWYDWVWIDHLVGEEGLDRARKILRERRRDGD